MRALWKLVALLTLTSAPVWCQSGSAPTPQATQPAQSSSKPTTDQTAPEPGAAPSSSADSTKLEPIKIEKAAYPEEAREKQLQGRVWVKFLVSETGDVQSVEVISGDPILAKSAVDALKTWKFKPFIKNGKPVSVSTKLPFDFAFSDRVKDDKAPGGEAAPAGPPPSAADPSGADTPKDATPQRIRIAQGVSQGLLVHRVPPDYPLVALAARVQGQVLLRAKIGKDGLIKDLHVISGHPMLAPSALDAVKQWKYKPYLLLGHPVEVETEITVNFTLAP
jgi:TonB family protein